MAVISGNDPAEVSCDKHANDPQCKRSPSNRVSRHERHAGDDETVGEGHENGFGETLSWRAGDLRTAKRPLRPDRDGDEEQPDDRAARAGAGQKELGEALGRHVSSPYLRSEAGSIRPLPWV